jgi:hypothetical protein
VLGFNSSRPNWVHPPSAGECVPPLVPGPRYMYFTYTRIIECDCIPWFAGSGSKKQHIGPENEMWEELAVGKAVYRQKGYGGTPHQPP